MVKLKTPAKTESEVKSKINDIDKRLWNVEQTVHREENIIDSSKLESRISDLEHLLSSIEVKLVKSGDHPHFEGKIGHETKLMSIENNLTQLLRRVNELELGKGQHNDNTSASQNYGKMPLPVSNSLSGSQDTPSSDIEGLRREFASLKIRDKSIDTNLVRIEERVKDYLESINHKLDLKIIDIEEKLDKAFENLPGKDHYEKHIELRIINMLSEKIEHFAQMLEKKMIDYPTKIEVERKLTRLEGMVAKLEHPDTRPLENRIAGLEMKLDDLTKFLNYHARRIPAVVE